MLTTTSFPFFSGAPDEPFAMTALLRTNTIAPLRVQFPKKSMVWIQNKNDVFLIVPVGLVKFYHSNTILVESVTIAVDSMTFAVESMTFAVDSMTIAVESTSIAVDSMTIAVESMTFSSGKRRTFNLFRCTMDKYWNTSYLLRCNMDK